MNLREFLEEGASSNAWVDGTSGLKFYVRCAQHCANGDVISCLDVANVEIPPGANKMTVMMAAKSWLDQAEVFADQLDLFVYVENVLNPQLLAFLKLRGYVETTESMAESGGISPCLVRPKG